VLLLTELTSAPDDKSIGIEYCQKISEKASPIPTSILHTKSIADTVSSNTAFVILTALIKSENLVILSIYSWDYGQG